MAPATGAQFTPLWAADAAPLVKARTRWPRAASASASETNAASAPPSGAFAPVRPSKTTPSSAITISAMLRRLALDPLQQAARALFRHVDGKRIHHAVRRRQMPAGLVELRIRQRGLDISGARTPRRVFLDVARSKEAERRRAGRGGDVHQAGVVADEQRGVAQDRGGGEQIDLADEIDDTVARQRRDHRRGLR